MSRPSTAPAAPEAGDAAGPSHAACPAAGMTPSHPAAAAHPDEGPDAPDEAFVLARTRAWVERAVIGLSLCPFARAVQARGQVRYVLTPATDTGALSQALAGELLRLADADPAQHDTTLLVHPGVLRDFVDYNDYLDEAEALLAALGLEGVLQVASFHPDYCFADADPDDPSHATNRSPYPTLHLLREESIDRAVESFPEADEIYERNIETLRTLGTAGWEALRAQCVQDAVAAARDEADRAPGRGGER